MLNQDPNRLHDDIDTVCRLKDMEKLREVFRQARLYQEERDRKNFAKREKDIVDSLKILETGKLGPDVMERMYSEVQNIKASELESESESSMGE